MRDCIFDLETDGLNPFTNRITVIGYKFVEYSENGLGRVISPEETVVISDESEEKLIKTFWEEFRKHRAERLTGFNCAEFDYPFILFRSLVHNIRGVSLFGYDDLLDLRPLAHGRKRLYGARPTGNLGDICSVLGIEHDGSMSGKMMVEAWLQGDVPLILAHCKDDVDSTYQLYKRMWECGFI